MAMDQRERDPTMMLSGARLAQNQPSQSADDTSTSDDLLAENDEPPDEQQNTPRPLLKTLNRTTLPPLDSNFQRSQLSQTGRKPSLLTAMIHTSGSENNSAEETENRYQSFASSRGLSAASISTASTAELTSDGGLTSPSRTATPSPPLPPVKFQGVAPIFTSPFAPEQRTQPIRIVELEHIGPLHVEPLTVSIVDEVEKKVEAGLGRKRCITFACGGRNVPKPAPAPTSEAAKDPAALAETEAPKPRRCMLTFACPTKVSSAAPDKKRAPARRALSPAPTLLLTKQRSPSPKPVSPPAGPRHRGSDATLRNESPTSTRKASALLIRQRRWSMSSDVCKREATRFHEFAGSADEVDEWTEEITCYRNRITVNDTLNVENEMKRLAEEVEAEEDEDEQDDEDEDDDDDDDDEEEDEEGLDGEDGDIVRTRSYSFDSESDDGFHSDNEEGFADSDSESDAGSAYRFWAPYRSISTAGTSADAALSSTLRPTVRGRSNSDSSLNSHPSTSQAPKPLSHISAATSKSRKIRAPREETLDDLPDSTDFVCGTLDEDRPKEMAFLAYLQQRKAAMHIPRPQDIDPTYPESDPEMDEEDEVDDEVVAKKHEQESESDAFFIHGDMDPHHDELHERRGRRGAPTKTDKRSPPPPARRGLAATRRSPPPPAKRTTNVHRSPPPPVKRTTTGHRSPPPPIKRTTTAHRSPPPKNLFGQSPRRMRSPPPPQLRLRSPPPTRRPSFQKIRRVNTECSNVFASSRQLAFATSLPRHSSALSFMASYDNEPVTPTTANAPEHEDPAKPRDIRVRGAIDIVKGLEKKRERRRMRHYEKQCRLAAQGVEVQKKRIVPGKGAEKMREVGLEIKAYRGRDPGRLVMKPFVEESVLESEREGLHMLSF